ncbi:putative T7SS-secreted protein [Rathayibacter sp. CAU 1779]
MGDTEYQPLTGDPTLLETKAAHYAEIADAIRRSVTTLHKIHDVDDMKSEAVDALTKSGDSVADDIDKAHDRYSKTAAALKTYAVGLREAQSDAETAITHINAKQTAADTAHRHATNTQQTADSATDDTKSDAQTAAGKAKDAAQHADAELRAAHQEWHNALDKKNAAAQVAIKAIVDVVDHHNNGLKNPSWWDKLVKVIEKIGDIAGVLAIFLSWVPILGQVLIVIAAVASIVKLVDSIVKFANGEGTFLDILGASVSCVLTLFGGRIFTFLGKAARIRSLTRAPRLLAGMRTEAAAAQRMRLGNTMMKNAVKDLFKVPRYATRADFVDAVKLSFTHSGEAERAAYQALFTGSSSRLKALGEIAGVKNSVVHAIRDDITHGYKDPLAAVAAFQQVTSLYNKAAGIVNVPSNVRNIFTDGTGTTAPSISLHDGAVSLGDKAIPTYKSYN